jgi:hypothetical protein
MSARVFCMVFRDPEMALAALIMRKGRDLELIAPNNQRPAAIRPLDTTGKVPVTTTRMVAIRKITTMAGSPDADRSRPASRNLAHGFCVLERPFFRES